MAFICGTSSEARKPAAVRRRRARRGFTLVEVVLSAMLGSIVVMAMWGLLSAIRSTDLRVKDRNDEAVQMSRLHRAVSRAASQLVVLPVDAAKAAARVRGSSGSGSGSGESGSGGGGAGGGSGSGSGGGSGGSGGRSGDGPSWRRSSEADNGLTRGGAAAGIASGQREGENISGTKFDARGAAPLGAGSGPTGGAAGSGGGDGKSGEGTGGTGNGQRETPPPPRLLLEADLGAAPALVADAQGMVNQAPAMQRLELVVSESPVLGSADGRDVGAERAVLLSKTRGAFAVRSSPRGKGLAVYWDTFELDSMPDPQVQRQPTTSMLVADGFESVRWTLARSDESGTLRFLEDLSVSAQDELPAFVVMNVTTIWGQSATYMLEVGWTVETRRGPTATNVADVLNPGGSPSRSGEGGGGRGGSGGGRDGRGGRDGGGETKPGGGGGRDDRKPDDGFSGLSERERRARERYLESIREGRVPQ
jgi:hypothetical protein